MILALAGSKGGSWSTNYSPSSGVPSQVGYTKAVGQATEIRKDLGLSIQKNSGNTITINQISPSSVPDVG